MKLKTITLGDLKAQLEWIRDLPDDTEITFGNGALTYPAGGIPLPAIGNFGFLRGIDFMAIQQPRQAYSFRFDKANHKLMMLDFGDATSVQTSDYANGSEVPTSTAPSSTTLALLLVGE